MVRLTLQTWAEICLSYGWLGACLESKLTAKADYVGSFMTINRKQFLTRLAFTIPDPWMSHGTIAHNVDLEIARGASDLPTPELVGLEIP
jgi:hypothetical protein